MIIRITRINGKLFFNITVSVPKGIRIIPKQFDPYISLAVNNSIFDILYCHEEWKFKSHASPYTKIDVENKTISSDLSEDEVLEFIEELSDEKKLFLVNFLYQ